MNLQGSVEREHIQEALMTGHQERGEVIIAHLLVFFALLLFGVFSLFLSAEFGSYLLETLVQSLKYSSWLAVAR